MNTSCWRRLKVLVRDGLARLSFDGQPVARHFTSVAPSRAPVRAGGTVDSRFV